MAEPPGDPGRVARVACRSDIAGTHEGRTGEAFTKPPSIRRNGRGPWQVAPAPPATDTIRAIDSIQDSAECRSERSPIVR